MKASILTVAAAVFALTASAYAVEPVQSGEGYQSGIEFTSTRTRAEVKAEAIAALRNGTLLAGEAYPGDLPPAGPAKTRQEVRTELAQAIKAGTLPRHE